MAVYSKFLFFGHISWDDPEMVFKNQAVKDFDLKFLFTNHFVGNYIPVTMMVHSFTWFIFENHTGGHHAVNILLHLLNGILIYSIGKHLFKNEVISNIGAIIFLLHPIQIESVAWISELKNVLSTTFYLAGILQYLNFIENESKKSYALCFLFFVLGCLSKSSTVVFPLSLICIDLIVRQKIIFKNFLNKIPFLVLSVLFGIINIKTQTADMFINHAHEFPYYQRVGFAGFAFVKYALLFLFPLNLSVIYPYPEIKTPVFMLGFFAIISLLSLLTFCIWKKKLNTSAVIVFIFVNLILVLQLMPFGEVLYADRYLYVPIIGLAWLFGMIISKIKTQVKFISILIILFFTVFTFARTNTWKSAIILYEDILKNYPDQFIALNSAGVECMFLNEDKKSLDYFDRATAIAPRNYKGFYNKGLLFLKNNKPELAIKSFNKSLELYDYGKAYTGRASAYYLLGDFSKAINDAQLALKTDVNNSKAHFVLANCYNDLNQLDEAMYEYNKSIELNKNEPDFYFKRAITFGKKQDFISCLNDLIVCTSIRPDYYEAYYWKGVAKINLKQNPCEDLKIAAQHNFEPAVNAFNKYCR
ncbi:tetratricopeptide repeat protein [Aurantibacillus circumpalustris]|uniref:tetratricopeptide repeat protein n=1 Tax=Aurantibacillus circumpalustris TaxID=3036359 RepID=UPI00295ADBB5|nr:tetratricopeptide repeat protein [Aurantibacillus circumpalustris]